MKPRQPWDDLGKFVLAMKRHGTMPPAARHLNANVATVSRRLERVSHELAIPLFEKRGTGFVPDEGRRQAGRRGRGAGPETARGDRCYRELDGHSSILEVVAPPAIHHRCSSRLVSPGSLRPSSACPPLRPTGSFRRAWGSADIPDPPATAPMAAASRREASTGSACGALSMLPGGRSTATGSASPARYPDGDALLSIYREAMATVLPRGGDADGPGFGHSGPACRPCCSISWSTVRRHSSRRTCRRTSCWAELWVTYHDTRHGDARCGPSSTGCANRTAGWMIADPTKRYDCRTGFAELPVATPNRTRIACDH